MLETSVKELEMVFNCPRRWAGHYLFGLEENEGEALKRGAALHTQMHRQFHGFPLEHTPESQIGKMARALQEWQTNKSGLAGTETQTMIELPEYGMKVDLRCDHVDSPIIRDWKTTGAERKSAKLENGKFWTPQTLTNLWQPNIYSFLAMHPNGMWPHLKQIQFELCFVCHKVKPGKLPPAWNVPELFTFEQTEAWFERYALPARDLILELREEYAAGRLDSLELVTHNPPSCEWSGRFCDAYGQCNFRPSPIIDYRGLHLPVMPG